MDKIEGNFHDMQRVRWSKLIMRNEYSEFDEHYVGGALHPKYE